MSNGWQALQRGESVRERRRQLELAHERFVANDLPHSGVVSSLLRPVVLQSWLRSRDRTIDPDAAPLGVALSADELAELRRTHPLSVVLPVVRRLLLQEATESGFIVALGDAAGRLLWVDGDPKLRAQAEDMGFLAGADWSEAAMGTSAPGIALELNHSLQVLGAEHYHRSVHQWSCTAAPVHDPRDGSVIGVIDVTGGDAAAEPHMLPLIEATLAAVEAEMRLVRLRETISQDRPAASRASSRTTQAVMTHPPRLLVLGQDPAVLEHRGQREIVSGRHAEILLALTAAPHGLTGAELAERVYGSRDAEATLRPEIVRLRRWLRDLGVPLELASKPYRLDGVLNVDAHELLTALERGAHRLALAAYDGPVLPASEAPFVDELRLDVDATLRESLLQSAAAAPLFEYAQLWASDDFEVWHTLLTILPPLSPRRARVVTKLEALEASASEAPVQR
ncbi:transcriptional regulator [Leucobacter insecticola]|uniref:Transcriptional regulator n=1 Tax=Leucobacter insecticola TaxID=2714934 RepID=A0A6G8FJ80_9MICO|nr:transcriptional regulator [Leucobacter insecticola]QIM16353.1 transcriptional regulator [Leucobacter insecticola]